MTTLIDTLIAWLVVALLLIVPTLIDSML